STIIFSPSVSRWLSRGVNEVIGVDGCYFIIPWKYFDKSKKGITYSQWQPWPWFSGSGWATAWDNWRTRSRRSRPFVFHRITLVIKLRDFPRRAEECRKWNKLTITCYQIFLIVIPHTG